jgi:hypothetical protein
MKPPFRLKSSLAMRILRNRHDNAVWFWQQRRVRRAMHRAFAVQTPLALDQQLVLRGGWPDADDPRPVVFAACDDGYFDRFGQHLALSSAARSPGTRVHLHLYEPTPKCLAHAGEIIERCGGRLTISHEGPARNPFKRPTSFYFAAGRFAVASRLRKEIRAPIMMVDADGLVANDLLEGFAKLSPMEAGFILQQGNTALYRRILASAIYLGTTGAKVEEFFTRLADGIGISLAVASHYHVDQIGIHYALHYCGLHHCEPRIEPLGLEWSDYRFAPESLIWSTKGARKDRYEELLGQVESGLGDLG